MKLKKKPTKPRVTWERKPQTQVVPNKRAYTRKQKHKGRDE